MRIKSLSLIPLFMLLVLFASNTTYILAAPIDKPLGQFTSTQSVITETTTMTTSSCQATHVVAPGDTLGRIAAQYTGVSYQAIFAATNAAATPGGTFSSLTDANVLSVGQTLCIPAPGTVITPTTPTLLTAPVTTTQTATETVKATLTDGKMMVNGVELPKGKIALSMKNLSPADIIVDIIGPTQLDAQFVIPNTQKVFILEPGRYEFNGASPGGAFVLDPGGFELKAGQWAEVLIYGSFYNQILHDGLATASPTATATAITATAAITMTTPTTSTTPPPANNASLAPTTGKARVYLKNTYLSEYSIDFGDGNGLIKVPVGVENLFYELAPGPYTPGLSLPGGGAANVELSLQADHSWLILVDESANVRVGQVYPELK